MIDDSTKAPDDVALSPQEDAFCRHFADPESSCYGNGTASAKAAGYAEGSAHTTAWKLKRRSRVIARLNELYKQNVACLDRVMSDLEHIRLMAMEKEDYATACRCAELAAKRHGAFLQWQVTVVDEARRELTDLERAEAKRIATLRIAQDVTGEPLDIRDSPAALPAPAVDDLETESGDQR